MGVRHLNQTELAERWNISPRTLERWRRSGGGPDFIKLGGRVLYRIEAFEASKLRKTLVLVGFTTGGLKDAEDQ